MVLRGEVENLRQELAQAQARAKDLQMQQEHWTGQVRRQAAPA